METPVEYFCHFHPVSPARWRCSKCSLCFDNVCVTAANTGKPAHTPTCPVCSAKLDTISNENMIQRKPGLSVAYMPDSPALLLICGTACLAAISTFSPIQTSLLLLLNQLLVFFLCFYYGQQTVFAKVYTMTNIKPTNIKPANRKPQRYLKTKGPGSAAQLRASLRPSLSFCALFLIPVYVFYQFHWLAGLLLMLLTAMLAPYLMLLILHQADTRHPLELKKLFAALYEHEKSSFVQILLLYSACVLIIDFTLLHAPKTLALALASGLTASALLCLLVMFARLYSDFSRALDNPQMAASGGQGLFKPGERNDQHPQVSSGLELALKLGNYEKAVALLETSLKQNPHSVLRRQQLYLLLTELNDNDRLSRYAELFLSWMMERGKTREASQFLYQLRKHDPAFLLNNIELMNELARLFTRQKKYALVLWLADASQKRFKPSEALAALHMSASQVLITHFQDLAKAEEYLLFVIRQCPGVPSAQAAKALLIHLQNKQSHEQQLRE